MLISEINMASHVPKCVVTSGSVVIVGEMHCHLEPTLIEELKPRKLELSTKKNGFQIH